MRYPRTVSLLAFAAAWAAAGCGSTDEDRRGDESGVDQSSSALMRRAQDCADLTQALQEDAREHLRKAMQEDAYWGRGVVGGVAVDAAAPANFAEGADEAPQAVPPSEPTVGRDSDAEASGPTDFTETNTQVEGIDEADFVKTDGQNIYVLRDGTLTMSDAWPAADLALTATAQIEGSVMEMYVVGDADAAERQVVVYSLVDARPLYEQAGLDPRQPNQQYYPLVPVMDQRGSSVYYELPATKATVLSATAEALEVVHEVYYEGSYVSSRRNGDRIRTVLHMPHPAAGLRLYPSEADFQKAELLVLEQIVRSGRSVADVPADEIATMIDERLGEVMVAENETAIAAITHEDWLPRVFVDQGGELDAAAVACEDFYIPAAGTSQQGITHIAQLDLAELNSSEGRAVLGVTDTMYENASTMVLASSTWDWPETDASTDEYVEPVPLSYVHTFDVSEPGQISYLASGIVDGTIYGQFALDEADGFLRVVTTEDTWVEESVNHLFVLEADDNLLEVVGDAGELAPGETVQSARFVGDTAYVVTFRQIDPLFVIDLSTPTQPTVLGELKIPGFSEYMHPMDDNHLLTVGRDADEVTGWSENVALQIFDVTDRTAPELMHRYIFERSGSTEGSVTHKAVTYYAERGLLALPFLGEEYTEDGWWYRLQSTMELFRVSLEDGIVPIGAVDAAPVQSDAEQAGSGYYCDAWYYNDSFLARGIFFDDILYAVARSGIIAASVDDPATPIASVRFGDPTEVPDYCYYEGVAGTGGTGGAATGGEAGGVEVDPAPATGGSASDAAQAGAGGTGAV